MLTLRNNENNVRQLKSGLEEIIPFVVLNGHSPDELDHWPCSPCGRVTGPYLGEFHV